MYSCISFAGLFVLMAIAWGLSSNRRVINWRVVGWGVGLQLLFGAFVFLFPPGRQLFLVVNTVVVKVLDGGYIFVARGATLDLDLQAVGVVALVTVVKLLHVRKKAVVGLATVLVSTHSKGAESGGRGSIVVDVGKAKGIVAGADLVVAYAGCGDTFVNAD